MRATRLSQLAGAVALWLAAGTLGCAELPWRTGPQPLRSAQQHDQLVIHSDYPIPQQHRLLEELRLQRQELFARLALTPSDEPIHIYLFDSEDSFSRFIRTRFPQFPSRRAFFVETDTQLTVYAHWGDRVAEDLRHEVAHGYLHSVLPSIPLWLDEGIAEFFETPRNQAGLNQPHVDELTRRIAEGWRPNIERLETLNRVSDMRQEDYAEAWAWTYWLLATDPARRDVLCRYLADIRGPHSPGRLSERVRAMDPNAEQSLVAFLDGLSRPR